MHNGSDAEYDDSYAIDDWEEEEEEEERTTLRMS